MSQELLNQCIFRENLGDTVAVIIEKRESKGRYKSGAQRVGFSYWLIKARGGRKTIKCRINTSTVDQLKAQQPIDAMRNIMEIFGEKYRQGKVYRSNYRF